MFLLCGVGVSPDFQFCHGAVHRSFQGFDDEVIQGGPDDDIISVEKNVYARDDLIASRTATENCLASECDFFMFNLNSERVIYLYVRLIFTERLNPVKKIFRETAEGQLMQKNWSPVWISLVRNTQRDGVAAFAEQVRRLRHLCILTTKVY